MTIEEAGEIVLSNAKPWLPCTHCKGYGKCRVYNGSKRLMDITGYETDVVKIAYFECHQCKGKAWTPNTDVCTAYGRLGMKVPDMPTPIYTPQLVKKK